MIEATQPEEGGALAQPSSDAAEIDTEATQDVAEGVSSTSQVDTDDRSGEEMLAEGLIPSDVGASIAETPSAEPAVSEDRSPTSGNEAAVPDSSGAAQVQIDESVNPVTSTAETLSEVELDPNSTAALIQVHLTLKVIPGHPYLLNQTAVPWAVACFAKTADTHPDTFQGSLTGGALRPAQGCTSQYATADVAPLRQFACFSGFQVCTV